EVRRRVAEPRVQRIRLLTFFGRALTWVLDRQCRRDDRDLTRDLEPVPFDDHAGEPGVHRQLREQAAHAGETGPGLAGPATRAVVVGRGQGSELGEQLDAVTDGARIGRFDEWE